MRGVKELKRLIENERLALDAAISNGGDEESYRISCRLDQLIEEYLDAKEKGRS